MLKKVLAFLLGHASALRMIAATAFSQLGTDILSVSPQVRGERIKNAVTSLIEAKYPQYAAYEGLIVDFVYDHVRAALAHK